MRGGRAGGSAGGAAGAPPSGHGGGGAGVRGPALCQVRPLLAPPRPDSFSNGLVALLATYSGLAGLGCGLMWVAGGAVQPGAQVRPGCGGGGGALHQAARPGHGALRLRHRGGPSSPAARCP
jgi:hypothetical protein